MPGKSSEETTDQPESHCEDSGAPSCCNEDIPFIITNLQDCTEEAAASPSGDAQQKRPDANGATGTTASKQAGSDRSPSAVPRRARAAAVSATHRHLPAGAGSDTSSDHRPRKKRSAFRTLLLLLVLLLPLSAIGGKFYWDYQKAEQQEALDYAVLCEENYDPEDYRQFLDKYPESRHREAVRKRLEELTILAAQWNAIAHTDDRNVLEEFKATYDNAHYAQLCDWKIDTLDWKSACDRHTPTAYQDYLDRHPEGRFYADALIAKSEVDYLTPNEQERNSLYDYCNQFFTAFSVNNAEGIRSYLAADVDHFLELKSPKPEDILAWNQKQKSRYAFVSYIVHRDHQVQKEMLENRGFQYTTTFQIEKIMTNEKGEELTQPLEATVKQNQDFQIQSLSVKYI